jgi:hypothetical protein
LEDIPRDIKGKRENKERLSLRIMTFEILG